MSRPPSRRAFSQTRHEQKGRGTVFPADDPSMWNLIDVLLCAVIPAIAGIQGWVILDACVEYKKYKGLLGDRVKRCGCLIAPERALIIGPVRGACGVTTGPVNLAALFKPFVEE